MTSKTDDVREAVAAALGKRRGHPDPWASDYYDADAALEVIALISPAPAGVADYARAVMDAAPTIKGGWDTAYKIADRLAALSAPETAPVALDEGAAGEPVDLWYPIKSALARAMQDERDGKPCGCIIEAGCEARGYHDAGYAADGFLDAATDAVVRLVSAHPSPPPATQDDRLRKAVENGVARSMAADDQWKELSPPARAVLMLNVCRHVTETLAALNPEAAK